MLIAIGSLNPVKCAAVTEYFGHIEEFSDARFQSHGVSSQVADQPISLIETIEGSRNRAQAAYLCHSTCTYGVGIEGGLMPVPYTATGYMNVCAASIFDGQRFYLGLSSAFEHPLAAISLVFKDGHDISSAYQAAGFAQSAVIGRGQGAIGFMTDGHLDRKDYCIQALIPAVSALRKQELLFVD